MSLLEPSTSMFRLDGHTALVTGAGGGLGQAIGDCLAQQGVRVFGTSREPNVADEIATRYGTEPVVLDVQDRAVMRATLTSLYQSCGGIDLLCNNAGMNIPQPSVDVDDASWDRVIDVNLSSAFFVQQLMARLWLQDGTPGRIVNVSSQAGTVAIEERAAYGASKAALSHLTRVLALEWAPHGIRVNAVAPTFIWTKLTESTLSREDMAQRLLARIPMGRFGTADEVASAVLYLLSDEASLVTGHILAVDGGYTIH